MSDARAIQLFDQFGQYLETRTPTARRATPLRRHLPDEINASQLDVDFVHSILTQADGGDARRLLMLYETIIYADSHLQGELTKRKLAVLGDPWAAQPCDEKNPADKEAARVVGEQLGRLVTFFDACSALLDGCLYPVVIMERLYRVATVPGLRYELADLVPVPMALLHFDLAGPLRIYDVDPASGTVLSTSQMLDPLRYVVHRGHLLGDRDHKGGPMRSLVFWWLFSAFDRDWWARFLDRYGGPFMVGKYDQNDDDSRLVLERAFALATKLGGIVISNETDVEIKQAMSKDAGDAFELFHGICQKEKSKLIVGQTTSASAEAAGGLGSGVGKAQSEVRDDIRQFDRLRLANTLKHQVITPFLRLNGIRGEVTIAFGAEAPEDTEKTSRSLAQLATAGIEVADEALGILGERMGLPLRRKLATAPSLPSLESPLSGRSTAATVATLNAIPPDLLLAKLADAANGRVARAGAADLAQAFRGDFAGIARALRESTDAADFESRLRAEFAGWHPARIQPLLEAGLTAYAANGTATT